MTGFTVNDNGDGTDFTPGNGICETATGNGICTLRAAAVEANNLAGDDTISFAPGVTLITLTSGAEIPITTNIAVNGPGANVLTVDGGAGNNRIFFISGSTVRVSGMTLQNGNGVGAGTNFKGSAIYITGGAVTLDRLLVQNNSGASSGIPDADGTVHITGGTNHVISNSTFTNNTARDGGGILAFNSGTIQVFNTTVSGNTANGGGVPLGGGILVANSTMTIRSSTVTGNSATGGSGFGGGGIYAQAATISIGNTIVSGNTSAVQPEIDSAFASVTTSAGFNLIGDSAGDAADSTIAIAYLPSDILDTPAGLGPLANNGGTTPTRALLGGSPALDKGNSFGNTTDQRGLLRPFDLAAITNAAGGDGADIGAFEAQSVPTAARVSISGKVIVGKGSGLRNAAVVLTDEQGNSRTVRTGTFGYFSFDEVEAGQTYIIAVQSKSYQFAPQVVSVQENVTDLDFYALAEGSSAK
ncbi:MAG: carboxypeptidase regulatory-like domain-containing protein [Acidobacteria bacterium]|nr:carboxypeptidase regulatory-like domain-containing protein [Acidobacteriota bacterium]